MDPPRDLHPQSSGGGAVRGAMARMYHTLTRQQWEAVLTVSAPPAPRPRGAGPR